MNRSPPGYGIATALTLIGLWGGSLVTLLTRPAPTAWSDAVGMGGATLWMTFLYTGLFITAHDAMHGTVAPGHRWLNDALGALATVLYALFGYRKLRAEHVRHHAHPGVVGRDPDFHDGTHRGPVRWYLHFASTYVGWLQIAGMAAIYNVLAHGLHVPEQNLIAFWVAPALLSTVQLFAFGTYLPHREPHDPSDPHRARSNAYPVWLSFLTCFHFGYHREHHLAPHVPWWRLPKERRSLPIQG